MKEYVLSLEEKTTQHWFSYFQIARKYYICVKILYDKPVIIFDDFGTCIWYLAYRYKVSCLYISQGHYFMCFLSMNKYLIIYFWAKVNLLISF